jgi:hypothetical protein
LDVQGEKITELFKTELKLKDVSRALLGTYYQEAFWREACQKLLDTVPYHRGGDWLSNLRRTEPDAFAARARGESERIYSSCSKGVHHEFVIAPGAYYDAITIKSLLQRSFELIGTLSIAANLCPTFLFATMTDRAVGLLEEAQKELATL